MNITKINSGKGLVTFAMEDLVDLDLTRWIRADSMGHGHQKFISVQPIEKAAAHAYVEKYPSTQVKVAEKCFLRMDGSVEVVLRIANEVSEGYYNSHPTKMTFSGDVKSKETESTLEGPTSHEKIEEMNDEPKKKSSGLSLPIDFIEEHISEMNDDEKRQIFAELGDENAEVFLRDLKLAIIDSEADMDRAASDWGLDTDEEENLE